MTALSAQIVIYIFGNPDLALDSLPLQIMPQLQKKFPQFKFKHVDPHEEWTCPPHLIAIDTVVGIKQTQIFSNLNAFVATPRHTMHDFDAFTNLCLLQKIGQLKKCTIFAIPPTLSPTHALNQISALITSNLRLKNEKRNSGTDRTLE